MTRCYVTATLGEPGYGRFLRELYEAGVLSHDEWLRWIALHAAVLALEPPLSDEEVVAAFEPEPGAQELVDG